MVFDVFVNGKTLRAMVDSGASSTFITTAAAAATAVEVTPSSAVFTVASGVDAPSVGHTPAPVSISFSTNGSTTPLVETTRLFVMDYLPYDIVLGTTFYACHPSLRLNFANRSMSLEIDGRRIAVLGANN